MGEALPAAVLFATPAGHYFSPKSLAPRPACLHPYGRATEDRLEACPTLGIKNDVVFKI